MPDPKMTLSSKPPRCHRKRKIPVAKIESGADLNGTGPNEYRPRSQGQRVRSWGRWWWDAGELAVKMKESLWQGFMPNTGSSHNGWSEHTEKQA